MPPVFWLTVLFVLASGLSAYIGNSWGRKLGKRKLSVFALRPRHTSTFLTILLSMSLSLGLLGSWLLLSPRARDAMFSPPQQRQPLPEAVQLAQQPRPASPSPSVAVAMLPSAGPEPAALLPAGKPAAPRALPVPAAAEQAPPAERPAVAQRPRNAPLQNQRSLPRQPLPTGTPSAPAQSPESPLAPERDARLALAASAGSQLPTAAASPTESPLSPAVTDAPVQTLFALQVYGGLKPAESKQLIQGVLDLTRDYARLIGSSADNAPLLQIQSQELAQSQTRLQRSGIYQLSVSLQPATAAQASLPVRLQIEPLPGGPAFDPHELLELARLESPATPGSGLRQELHLAMQSLAEENRQSGSFKPAETLPVRPMLKTASLPFEIINLRRSGSTLQGQIIMNTPATNLTEN